MASQYNDSWHPRKWTRSFLSPRAPGQSDDTLERRPKSLALGVCMWNPPTGQPWACSVQIREIYKYPPLAALLLYYYGICQPFLEIDFLYCPNRLQPVNFRLHCFDILPNRSSRLLFLRGNDGSMLSLWIINSGLTPGTSYGVHAKTSKFCISNNNVSTLSWLPIFAPIWKYLLVSDSILTLISSSA